MATFPEAPKPTRRGMQTAFGSLDFDELTDKMKELLSLAWGDEWGIFEHDEPTGNDPEKISLPVITYDTFERTRSSSHKSLEPIRFDRIKSTERVGEIIDLYRMWFDIDTEFKIYHKTNKDARILMRDFEDFLWKYKSYFQEIGISDIVFLKETKPQVVEKFGQRLTQRTLRYLIRVERISQKIVRSMDSVQEVAHIDGGFNEPLHPSGKHSANSIVSHYEKQIRL